MLFQHIFQYMDNYINGRSKIRMMMIGGHDVTVAPFMDFLSGLNIIPRTHYPHYACNVVMELRKYGQDFYLEFYYNDVLKYNNTLEIFKSILNNSKYSNLYNYCGIPSYLNISLNNATNQTINNQTVKNETKIENVKNETNQTINNQTVNNESKIENVKNETNNTINNQNEKTQSLQNSTIEKETEKVEIIENNPHKNLLNNNDSLAKQNETSRENQGKNFIQKSINYLAQQDMNFYIIVICACVVIVTLIAFAIFVFIWRKNRQKRYIKFKEDVAKNVNPNNLSIMSSNMPEAKSEPQSNA